MKCGMFNFVNVQDIIKADDNTGLKIGKYYNPTIDYKSVLQQKKEEQELNELKLKWEELLCRYREDIERLEKHEYLIAEFDEELWKGSIEKVVVNVDNKITFICKNDMELGWEI